MITAYVTPEPTTVVQLVTAVESALTPTPMASDPTTTPPPSVPPQPVYTDNAATTTVPPLAPSPTYPPPNWALPAQFTDLSAFSVQKYAGGESNIVVVTGIPATASAASAPQPTSTPVTPWDNTTDNAMQLLFPQGSINPGNKPQGGADFYATPIDLSAATNVTMEYSVFMDAGMEWVKGGKLPGLYGGHEGCSGGNVADTCFSTRLMWRPQGVGELYLVSSPESDLVNCVLTNKASPFS